MDYGTDLYCVDDMDDMDREVEGVLVVIQDILHSLSNARGRFITDETIGTDSEAYLSLGMTQMEMTAMASRMRAEVEDHEAVRSATVQITMTGEEIDVRIQGELVNGEPLDFVVSDWLGVRRVVLAAAA